MVPGKKRSQRRPPKDPATASRNPRRAPTEAGQPRTPRRRFIGWKKWTLRVVLVFLAPALVIGLLEGGLSLINYGYRTSYWIKSAEGDTYFSNPDFGVRFFGRDLALPPIRSVVSRTKPENTYRIFVFGGSAAFGSPDPTFSFARILEAMLNERFPGARFEIINTGMTAINSHVAYEIARDCRGFGGDLYVVYMGNNEVVGPYGPGTVFMGHNPGLRTIRMNAFLKTTRCGQFLADRLGRERGPKEWRGMTMFLEHCVPADDPRLESTYENFRTNLRDICRNAHQAGAKVILSTIITNLKDLPPFASAHRAGLSAGDEQRWETLYHEGTVLQNAADYAGALQHYEEAEKTDDRFAELHFRMGRCYLALNQYDRARRHFIQARDLDTLRFRADTRINEIIRATAGELTAHDVYLLDAADTVSGKGAAGGIHGAELLYEHVHLTFDGNYALAAAMFRTVVPLLAPSVVKNAAGLDPPALERCAELLVYTPYARYRNREWMLGITGHPPFPAERLGLEQAEVRRLRAQLTPGVLEEVRRAYRERLQVRPDDLTLRISFEAFETFRGDHQSAAEQTSLLLQRYPYAPPAAHQNLGNMLKSQGRFQEAVKQYEAALRDRPDYADAHSNLGVALQALGRFEKALAHHKEALRLKPDDAALHNNLAWLLATSPDPAYRDAENAVVHARRASELSGWKSFGYLDTLAAACAASGDFSKAMEWQEKALELAPEQHQDALRRNLELYRAGKPLRVSENASGTGSEDRP